MRRLRGDPERSQAGRRAPGQRRCGFPAGDFRRSQRNVGRTKQESWRAHDAITEALHTTLAEGLP